MLLVSACSWLCKIYLSQVLSGEWKCPTTDEWSTIQLPIKMRLILETWRYICSYFQHLQYMSCIMFIPVCITFFDDIKHNYTLDITSITSLYRRFFCRIKLRKTNLIPISMYCVPMSITMMMTLKKSGLAYIHILLETLKRYGSGLRRNGISTFTMLHYQ